MPQPKQKAVPATDPRLTKQPKPTPARKAAIKATKAKMKKPARQLLNLEAPPPLPATTGKKCGAKLRGKETKDSGRTCVKPAGYGTQHLGYGKCKFHGGNAPAG